MHPVGAEDHRAGAVALADEEGEGCRRIELRGDHTDLTLWKTLKRNWIGGGCYGLTFAGDAVYAATWRAGVLRLDGRADDAAWRPCSINAGLPLRDAPNRFAPVYGVAVHRDAPDRLLVGGPEGVFGSTDEGAHYAALGAAEFVDAVTLPPTWVFVSGEHALDLAVRDDRE